MKTYNYNHSLHRVIFALILIVIGLVFVFANTGVITPEWKSAIISWPMLIIALSIIQFCSRSITSGLVFAAVGIFFEIPKLYFLFPAYVFDDGSFARTYWPVLLIVVGLLILIVGSRHKHKNWNTVSSFGGVCSSEGVDEAKCEDGKINYKFMFSGAKNIFLEPVFKGGTIEATFGGIEFDLRRTSLPEGTTTLYINTTFGGAVLYIPPTWYVEIQNQSVMGAFEDHRWKSPESVDTSRKLLIIARATLGGGEIK